MRLFNNYRELRDALDLEPDAPGAFRFLEAYGPAAFTCSHCGEPKPLVTNAQGGGTGYGLFDDELMLCYPCCGLYDRDRLHHEGTGYLYLNSDTGTVSNWCGSLVLRGAVTRIADDRVTFTFELSPGDKWGGVLRDKNNNMLAFVRRVK